MVVNSNEKGGEWEREVARRLSLWLTYGEARNELIRSRQSGGWKFRNEAQIGDLAPNGVAGRRFRECFAVECKHRAPSEIDWWHIWSSPNYCFIVNEWAKLMKEVADSVMEPLIFMKANRRPALVGFRPALLTPPLEVRSVVVDTPSGPCRFVHMDYWMGHDPEYIYAKWRALHEN